MLTERSQRSDTERLKLCHQMLDELVSHVDLSVRQEMPEEHQRDAFRRAAASWLDEHARGLSPSEREQVVQMLLNEIFGLGVLEGILRDPTVTDILINGPHEVYVERRGRLELADVQFLNEAHLLRVVQRIVNRLGKLIDETHPMVDARLPDGSRLNAIIHPLARRGPYVSIRRFPGLMRTADLIARGALTREMAAFLEACVLSRLNVIISGGTGSGKTTLLNALSAYIPNNERVVTIEDAAELQLQQRHVLSLESRPPNIEGQGAVTQRDLVRNALRMRPDRIILGECRGGEALDMLQAMNTGHDGSLTTLHANSTHDALSRLEMLVEMAGIEIPVRTIRRQIASAIQIIVHVSRLKGGARKIVTISEICGMRDENIKTNDLFMFQQTGLDAAGNAMGKFAATGNRPYFEDRFKEYGLELPDDLFVRRPLQEEPINV